MPNMSSDQNFSTLVSTIDQVQMAVDAASASNCSEWYDQSSYVYNDPYMNIYPTSTLESQPWPGYVRTSLPDINMNAYGVQPSSSQQLPPQMRIPHRARNSPSQLGLSSDELSWPVNGLGIQYNNPSNATIPTPPASSTYPLLSFSASAGIPTPPVSSTFPPISFSASAGVPTPPISSTFPPGAFSAAAAGISTPPVTSTFPPASYQPYAAVAADDFYNNIPSPDLNRTHSRKSYSSIAPNPSPIPSKRKLSDAEAEDPTIPPTATSSSSSSSKRRKRYSSTVAATLSSATLNDEDRLLLHLKEEENLPWKSVIVRFASETKKSHTVASLQMRYKRLRDKHRVWEEVDLEALRKAHEWWEGAKWEIISSKMLEYNIEEKWPSRNCARKWQELEHAVSAASSTMGYIPATTTTTYSHFTTSNTTPGSVSQLSSPIDGPVRFNWMAMS